MALLDPLTDAEADRLWWRIYRAVGEAEAETDHLLRCPRQVRDDLYGPGALSAMAGMMAELRELLDTEPRFNPLPANLAGGETTGKETP